MSAAELYQLTFKAMSPAERLQLASLILNDLVAAPAPVVDESDEWSDEDIADLQKATWAHIETQLGDDDAVAR